MSVGAHWGRRIKRFMEQSASYQSSSEQTTIGHMYKHKQTDSLPSTVGRSPSTLGGRINDGSSFFPPNKGSCVRNTHSTICGSFFFFSLRSTLNTTCNTCYRLRNTVSSIQDCVSGEKTRTSVFMILQRKNLRSNSA